MRSLVVPNGQRAPRIQLLPAGNCLALYDGSRGVTWICPSAVVVCAPLVTGEDAASPS